jgi:glycosyltransferase involved in cell wall biosynthesis
MSGNPKILIVRCSRLPHFSAALERVKQEYPGHEIHVLAKRSLAEECRSLPGVQNVLLHPDRPFSLLKTIPGIAHTLRLDHYALVVLPVSTPTRTGYLNVELAALSLRFRRIATFTPDGRWIERGKRQFLREDVIKGLLLLLAEWADAPLLILMLLAAQSVRPIRWLRKRVFGVPEVLPGARIMHCISSLGMGGAQRQMLKVMKSLAPRYDVSLCMLNGNDLFFASQLDRIGVRSTVLSRGSHAYALSALRLCRLLREDRIDVLHTWLPQANVVGALAGFFAKTPCIVTSERNITSNKYIWYPQWWFRLADSLAARLCTVVSTNAEAVRDDFARYTLLPRKCIAVIYNGSEDDEFQTLDESIKERLRAKLNLDRDHRVVGIFGRLEPEKDHATFLRAIRSTTEHFENLRVLIVGGGSLEGQTRALAGEFGLFGCVRFLGSRTDATSLMQICDVVVLSSTSEGMPNALLEAQHLGIPVVTTDAGGSREIVRHGETGYVVPIGHHDELARHIEILLASPQIAQKFGDAARRRIHREFTLHRTVSGFEELYRRNLQTASGWKIQKCETGVVAGSGSD